MEIAPGVHLVRIPTQTLPPEDTTNAYLVGGSRLALIDLGSDRPEALAILHGAVERIPGVPRIEYLLPTHQHPDHLSGMALLKRERGAKIAAHVSLEPFVEGGIDLPVADGSRVELQGFELTAVHTPGHASGHLCWYLPSEGILFSGDHIVGQGTVVIIPPDGDMADYLASLERLRLLDLKMICPAHGPLILDPHAKIREYIDHRIERERQVLEALRGGAGTPEEVVAQVYTDVPASLHGLAAMSVQAHLIKLEREGRARRDAEGSDRYLPA